MQSNEPQRPDDRELIVLINEWVRHNPQELAEAGQFLDEYYSDQAIKERDIAQREEDKQWGVADNPARRPSKLLRFSYAKHDLLAQFGDIYPEEARVIGKSDDWNQPPKPWSVALGLPSNPKSFDVMRRADCVRIAKLVLLLSWLATDPDADTLQ